MDYLEGTIKAILFYDEESRFTITKITVTESSTADKLFSLADEEKTVKGNLPDPKKGEHIRFHGCYENHPEYGSQFRFERYERLKEASVEGIVEYLSSGLFPGVGEKSARRIVETLGKEAIQKISRDERVLDDIERLPKKAKTSLAKNLRSNKATEGIRIRLLEKGVTNRMIERILKVYGESSADIVENDPYRLIRDIDGIGFERADRIAESFGIEADDPRRIRALIEHQFMVSVLRAGHTHIDEETFIDICLRRLSRDEDSIGKESVEKHLRQLLDAGRFVKDGGLVTTSAIRAAETDVVEKVKGLLARKEDIDTTKVREHLGTFEKLEGIAYTPEQKEAILEALRHPVMVLTGGPGTGKTTVIKGIVEIFTKYHSLAPARYDEESEIHLIAPTGRAAKRMNEATRVYASTIHRFLGYSYDGTFQHDRHHPRQGELFIVDEASMIDTPLAGQLFQSLPDKCHLVIVGDDAQLPSVGPGQVLRDLLESGTIPSITLKTIHRQAQESKIVELASHVRTGSLPPDLKKPRPDRYIIPESPDNFHKRLKRIIDYFLEKGLDLHRDIQVLIPMYKGETGIDRTNAFLQAAYNKNTAKHLSHKDRRFLIGDKVLQLVNQPEDGIMNGDQGVVEGIDKEKRILHVRFDDKEVAYESGDLENLTHAYAMSIHKSQGSEYRMVVLPLFKSHRILLKRKLIYTAITRAEETLVIIGHVNLLFEAVRELEENRKTRLAEKLADSSGKREEAIDKALSAFGKDILKKEAEDSAPSPYDFLEGTPPSLRDETPDKSPYDFLSSKADES